MTTQTATYELPEAKLAQFCSIVSRVEKRAAKLGLPAITHRTVSERLATIYRTEAKGFDGTSISYRYIPEGEPEPTEGTSYMQEASLTVSKLGVTTLHTIEVTGEEPYLEGHRFLASIDHEPGETNVVSCVPGSEAPAGLVAEWLNAPANCAHCGLNRRRLNTYLLLKDDGSVVQVGSTCIKDYFPGTAADDIAALAQLWVMIDLAASGDADYEGSDGASSVAGWMREDVLSQAAACVREAGWVSKAQAQDGKKIATASCVVDALTWRPSKWAPTRPFPVTAEDVSLSEEVISWVDSLDPSMNDDYLWNLKSATGRKVTKVRHIGIVVSAIGAYRRTQEREATRKAESEALIPVAEGRYEMTGTVVAEDMRSSDWGTTHKVLVLVDADGGQYKVWGTDPLTNSQRGDRIRFTARVERSKDDMHFGYFSRPSKGQVA